MRFMTDRGQWIVAEMSAVPLMAADGLSTQVLGGLFTFPDPDLKHYDAVTGRELMLGAHCHPARRRRPSRGEPAASA